MIAMIAGVVAADVAGSVENVETVEDTGAIVEGEAVETLTVDHRVATRAPHHRKCGFPAQKVTS